MEKCSHCGWVGPVVTEDVFCSQEAKDRMERVGVMFTEDAFASEIWHDDTEDWECSLCWWNGWWDI